MIGLFISILLCLVKCLCPPLGRSLFCLKCFKNVVGPQVNFPSPSRPGQGKGGVEERRQKGGWCRNRGRYTSLALIGRMPLT